MEIRGIKSIPNSKIEFTPYIDREEFAFKCVPDIYKDINIFIDGEIIYNEIYVIYQKKCNSDIRQTEVDPHQLYTSCMDFFSEFHKTSIHNDIKVQNFVVCNENKKYTIIDFGLVTSKSQIPNLDYLGTPAYFCPMKTKLFSRDYPPTQVYDFLVNPYEKGWYEILHIIYGFVNPKKDIYKNFIYKIQKFYNEMMETSYKSYADLELNLDLPAPASPLLMYCRTKSDEFALFITLFALTIIYVYNKKQVKTGWFQNDNGQKLLDFTERVEMYKHLITYTFDPNNILGGKSKSSAKHVLTTHTIVWPSSKSKFASAYPSKSRKIWQNVKDKKHYIKVKGPNGFEFFKVKPIG